MTARRQDTIQLASRMRSSAYARRTLYMRYRGVGSMEMVQPKAQLAAKQQPTLKPKQVHPRQSYPTVRHVKQPSNIAVELKQQSYATTQQPKSHKHLTPRPDKPIKKRLGAEERLKTDESRLNEIPKSRPKSTKSQYRLLTAAAVIVFILGVAASINTFLINRQTKQQVTALSGGQDGILQEGDTPDESEPDKNSSNDYRVAPDMPRFIRILKIGIESRVLQMGVSDKNQLLAPSSIYDTGWYTGSAKPGETGVALIDGHVSGPTRPGVFKQLGSLNAGDRIEIERGDGKIIKYEVVRKQSYPYEETDMAAALRSIEPGRNGLNLITCDGRFNVEANNYDNRLIVFTVEL
ncbi:hypothetical protein BH23PAT2_BH23PAT2_02810 [soil metagenome]